MELHPKTTNIQNLRKIKNHENYDQINYQTGKNP